MSWGDSLALHSQEDELLAESLSAVEVQKPPRPPIPPWKESPFQRARTTELTSFADVAESSSRCH